VTNEQFAEFLNAPPVKPFGTALGSTLRAENIAPSDPRLVPRIQQQTVSLNALSARSGVRHHPTGDDVSSARRK
jgi:hypothetical protein